MYTADTYMKPLWALSYRLKANKTSQHPTDVMFTTRVVCFVWENTDWFMKRLNKYESVKLDLEFATFSSYGRYELVSFPAYGFEIHFLVSRTDISALSYGIKSPGPG